MKKFLAAFIIIVFIVFLIVHTWVKGIQTKIFIPQKTTAASAPSLANTFQSNTPFNLVLLGYGGGNHDGAYLTDSIIVLHIDPMQKKITLISVPRDIWTKIPTSMTSGTYMKINAAYEVGLDNDTYPNKAPEYQEADGGGHLAEYVIGQVIGLPIHNFVGMDFTGFEKTIDTLGGVDINVETAFNDNQYPIEGNEDNTCGRSDTDIATLSAALASPSATITELDAFPCRYEDLHFAQGLQHMDGATALKYVRSRHSVQDGTDFGRSKRQRNLLVAVKEKIMSIGFLPKAIPFISSLQDDLQTDLTPDDVSILIERANDLNKYSIQNLAITDQNFLVDSFSQDNQAVLIAKAGQDNWTQIHNWIQSYIDPNYTISNPIIQIENGTGTSGLAEIASKEVSKEGYTVLDPTTAAIKQDKTTITVFKRKIDKKVLTKLESEFSVKDIQTGSSGDQNYDILITLGNYYTSQAKSTISK